MLKKVTCPSCGKSMDIPAELTEFSCLYCGEKNVLTDGKAFASARQDLKPRLVKTVTHYGDYYRKMTRSTYLKAFAVYEKENTPVLRELDACVEACPEGMKKGAAYLAEDFMEGLVAHMKASGRWEKKRDRQNLLFETRIVLAVFLTPLVGKLGLVCAEAFRKALRECWLGYFPDQNWTPGDYAVLYDGYQKRKLCFITTAVCAHEGKADDCAELTAFRGFRDGYLTERGDGKLIDEYYEVAPAIVACINLCDDADKQYGEIRRRWLEPCYQALKQGRLEQCRDTYIQMVRCLEKRYFS